MSKKMPEISKDTLNKIQNIVKKKGGILFTKKYKKNRTKLKVKCAEGHLFYPLSDSLIRLNTWCRTCSYKNSGQYKKLSISYLKKFALKKGGKCLSSKYIRLESIYEWRCENGHEWSAKGNNITINKTWCPRCKTRINEEYCRITFEQLFKKKFPKTRPKWLRNNSGNLMEIDGYNDELKLGFEYQGEQHFNIHYFNKDRAIHNFKQRTIDDKLKKKLCKQNGVILITISFKDKIVDFNKIIKKQLRNTRLEKTKVNYKKTINLEKSIVSKSKIKEMRDLAITRGGRCLSKVYINARSKIKWECKRGHKWLATPGHIKNRNQWCPYCAKIKKEKWDAKKN